MARPPVRRTVLTTLGAGALVVPLIAAVPSAAPAAPSGSHLLSSTRPSWASPDRVKGAPKSSSRVSFRVQLKLRDEAGLEQQIAAVSTPGSAARGHYLSSAQFNARYAPTAASVAAVEGFLRSHGITVGDVPSNRRWINASGSVAGINAAFQTSLKTYDFKGRSLRAPSTALAVPEAIADSVLTVTGVYESPAPARPNAVRTKDTKASASSKVSGSTAKASPSAAPSYTPKPSVCSNYFGQHTNFFPGHPYGKSYFPTYQCSATPSQLRQMAGIKDVVAGGQTGRGTKVAIIDAYASPTISYDANRLSRTYGEPTLAPGQLSQKYFTPFTDAAACGGEANWWGEETLDVQSVHAMAPGADILYIGAQNCGTGLDDAQNWVTNNFDNPQSRAYGVSMVSNSYGIPGESIQDPAEIEAQHEISIQAAIEGLGFYFSTGDDGDNVVAGYVTSPEPSYQSSDPYVTGVGGTSTWRNKAGNIAFQTAWGEDRVDINTDGTGYTPALPGNFYFGGGGGTSVLFNQPWYQRGIVPNRLAEDQDGTPNRVVPDVSLDADPETGTIVGFTDPAVGGYVEEGFGGTSLSTPLMVGFQAVVQGHGPRIGFANPTLYSLGSSAYLDVVPSTRPIVFVNPGGNALYRGDRDSTLKTAVGYDDATGLGTPHGPAFISAERRAIG